MTVNTYASFSDAHLLKLLDLAERQLEALQSSDIRKPWKDVIELQRNILAIKAELDKRATKHESGGCECGGGE